MLVAARAVSACVGWGLPHRRTTMPGAVYGGFGVVYHSADKPLSLASQAMLVAARAVPVPQGQALLA